MHHWVKYRVNWCMKSEVIVLASFVMDRRMHARTDGQTDVQHFYVTPFTMASKAMVGCMTGSNCAYISAGKSKVIVVTRFCIAT